MSDVFLPLAALEAEAAGALDLDATVKSILPSLDLEPASWLDALTVRDLVFRTDGLPSGINDTTAESIPGCASAPGMTVEDVVTSLSGQSMGAPPGRYQTRGIWALPVLARVLEASDDAGRTHAEIVRDRLFTPLGMTSAAMGWTDGGADGLACGHDVGVTSSRLESGQVCEAALQARASLEDLARFVQVLANGGVTAGGERVLAASTLDGLFGGVDAPTWISDDVRSGAGLYLWPSDVGPVAATAGGGFGWEMAMAVVPDRRFAVVVLLNGRIAPGPVTPVLEVMRPFLQARLGIDGPEPPYRPAATWAPSELALAEIAGVYQSVEGDELELTTGASDALSGVLRPRSGGTIDTPLEPRLTDRFNAFIAGRQPAVRVFRDGAGEPTAIWMWDVEHILWRELPSP